MKPVTIEQLRGAIKTHKISRWILRRCSFCHTALYYSFGGRQPTYSTACDCVTYESRPDPRTWDEVLDCFNAQTPEIREKMWAEFVTQGERTIEEIAAVHTIKTAEEYERIWAELIAQGET